ncbi:MAG: YegS/Rv2252/BmrU family lipid kinase [Myxococcaceae bacterium]|nr:YegS/Rv2252/BmrU family lipid kinase [Myxococcaceae bacterium]
MRHFLVVNPGSANGDTGRRWPELAAAIARGIGAFEHAFTEGPMDGARIATRALEDGFDCIAAVGGDGTINEVVNGFFRDGRAINPKAALAVVPRGTGGDFRKTFNWDTTLESAVARLASPSTRPMDVGLLEFTDPQGRKATRYFANICSFGVSGLVDQEVNKRSKALGGRLSFLLGSTRALLRYKDRRVRFVADDRPAEEVDVTTLAVANGRYFGGGMKVAPDADPSDGLFDVTLWSGYTLMDFAFKSRAIYDGTHVNFAGTRRLRCTTLSAEPADGREVLLDVDGEQPGRLPCRMSILPSAMRLKT